MLLNLILIYLPLFTISDMNNESTNYCSPRKINCTGVFKCLTQIDFSCIVFNIQQIVLLLSYIGNYIYQFSFTVKYNIHNYTIEQT